MHGVRAILTVSCWMYVTYLAVWFMAYVATGDRFRLMALLNAGALYFFVPLPLLGITAIWTWRRELLAATVLALAVFLWLWGGLFVPHPGRAQTDGATLTIMTYNTLGPYAEAASVLAVIRAENADVVLLQEVNPQVGMALRDQLADLYPYQVRRASSGVGGMATISKLPLRENGDRMPRLLWVGSPQVMTLEWDGTTVTLVNFHMNIPPFNPATHGSREPQARALVDYGRQVAALGPYIAAGDTNVTELSDTYKILTSALRDSWHEGGFGFGHTWGATGIPSGLRGVLPTWLVRIDYVFHSAELRAIDARTARHDGVSDHRGVVATLMRQPFKDIGHNN